MENDTPNCARCPFKTADRFCKIEDGKNPSYCPTKNKPDLIERCLKEYDSPDVTEFAKQAAIQEADGYANREIGYERLGHNPMAAIYNIDSYYKSLKLQNMREDRKSSEMVRGVGNRKS
jgi:hypothetical protein